MFEQKHLRDIVILHEKSFALLKWVRAALKEGSVSFAVIHGNTDSASAAVEWIRRHVNNIPNDARPDAEQIPAFARLFLSFLTTSFRLKPNSMQLVSKCGCLCSYCSYLRAGPDLEPRTPSKKDVRTATELKRIYLGKIATEIGIVETNAIVEALLESVEISEDISVATWGSELLRRSEYASQGEAVLALWRQFAWRNNSPKPKFRISVPRLLDAERMIIAAMEAARKTKKT